MINIFLSTTLHVLRYTSAIRIWLPVSPETLANARRRSIVDRTADREVVEELQKEKRKERKRERDAAYYNSGHYSAKK